METPFDASELRDVAKTDAGFSTQYSNLPIRPRAMIARAVVTSPAANLPLLPTPKPLQTEKRARNAELIDTHKGSRVIVLNLPHETQFKDVTRLFDPYSVECINLLSHSPGHAIVHLASAEEASRAIRELSEKLLQGSSISFLFEEYTRATPSMEVEGGNFSLSSMQMALEEPRPPKRLKSDQTEASLLVEQHIEQNIRRDEFQARKKVKKQPPKEIEYLIGGLSPDAKAYQVKAFLDSHQIYCSSCPQKVIRRNKYLGFYTTFKLPNNEQSRANVQRLLGQHLNGSEIKIRLAGEPVAAMDKFAKEPQHQRTKDEADLVTQCAIVEGRRACVSNLKHSTTEDDLRKYFRNYAVESVTMDITTPLRPSEGYPAFIDFQSTGEMNRARSDLHTRQDAGDLLPVYYDQNVRLRNSKMIFTVWNKEKEEERKARAPATRKERHANRCTFSHYTLRIAGLPCNATEADVRHLFPEIDFDTITLKPSACTNCLTSYAIAEVTMNVNQERAISRFKPRGFQGYSVTIAMDTERDGNHSCIPISPALQYTQGSSWNDPNDGKNSSSIMTVQALPEKVATGLSSEKPDSEKAHPHMMDRQALPDRVTTKPRLETPVYAETRSNLIADTALPNTVREDLSSEKFSKNIISADESKALDRKALREWWIREKGIWLDL